MDPRSEVRWEIFSTPRDLGYPSALVKKGVIDLRGRLLGRGNKKTGRRKTTVENKEQTILHETGPHSFVKRGQLGGGTCGRVRIFIQAGAGQSWGFAGTSMPA